MSKVDVMKGLKTWLIVTGLVVVTALAGHFLGRVQGEREVLAERQREVDARVAKQRAIGESIARHVRASDEIVLVTFVGVNPRETRQVFRDDAWRAKLVALLLEAPCKPVPFAFRPIPLRTLEFRTNGEVRLSCMWWGGVLLAFGEGIRVGEDPISGGDFFVGDAVTDELSAWVNAKK